MHGEEERVSRRRGGLGGLGEVSFTIRSPLLVAAIAASCIEGSWTAEIVGRRPLEPLDIYREWWTATEDCSGITASFDRIDWYLATSITGDGAIARARWSEPHDIIVVAGYEDDPAVVRHEMLHDLLNGDRLHGDRLWDVCGLRSDAG